LFFGFTSSKYIESTANIIKIITINGIKINNLFIF